MTITQEELKEMRRKKSKLSLHDQNFLELCEYDRCLDEIERLQSKITVTNKILKKAEEMAKFYGEPKNWESSGGFDRSIVLIHPGERARAFLEELKNSGSLLD